MGSDSCPSDECPDLSIQDAAPNIMPVQRAGTNLSEVPMVKMTNKSDVDILSASSENDYYSKEDAFAKDIELGMFRKGRTFSLQHQQLKNQLKHLKDDYLDSPRVEQHSEQSKNQGLNYVDIHTMNSGDFHTYFQSARIHDWEDYYLNYNG